MPGGVASYGTLSVVGSEVWFVGGYDDRVNLTGRDLRVPIAASERGSAGVNPTVDSPASVSVQPGRADQAENHVHRRAEPAHRPTRSTPSAPARTPLWRRPWVVPLALLTVSFVAYAVPPYLTLDPAQARLQPLPPSRPGSTPCW